MSLPGEVPVNPSGSPALDFDTLLQDPKHSENPTKEQMIAFEDEQCDYMDQFGTEYYFRGAVIYVRLPYDFTDKLRSRDHSAASAYMITLGKNMFSVAHGYSLTLDKLRENNDYLFYFVASAQNSPDLNSRDVGISDLIQSTMGEGIDKGARGATVALLTNESLGTLGRIVTNSSWVKAGGFEIIKFEGKPGENIEVTPEGHRVIKKEIVKESLGKAADFIQNHSATHKRRK